MAKTRNDQSPLDTWDLSSLYVNNEAWLIDFNHEKNNSDLNEIANFKGKLHTGPTVLFSLYEIYFKKVRALEKLYTFAHLKHDEDITLEAGNEMLGSIEVLTQQFYENTSWIEPELLAFSKASFDELLNSPILAPYKFHLEKLYKIKDHILSQKEEELLALASRALLTPYKTFSSLNNADFRFGSIKDSQDNEQELTHALYQLYLQSRDPILRENAFKKLHGKFSEYKNTLADLLQGQTINHFFEAKSRKFSSCLEAALKPKNIDLKVYKSLINAVKQHLEPLHEYFEIRKKMLGQDKLHLWDLSVPLTKQLDIQLSYKEAEELVIRSVAPLGSLYQKQLKEGLEEKRWVDRYENQNKRSGAYSSGCFDSEPYILMNFKGVIRDLFTLAHECGHSMHSLLSRIHQPFHYSQYPIFVAEVASTFNEELLFDILYQEALDKESKIYYLTSRIDDIRATLIRQTLFAEFELTIHEWVEAGKTLTPQLLSEEYKKLNEAYYGKSVIIDEEISIEWARIPHFYYNFYVYQYATGISAAIALFKKVKTGGAKEQEAYLKFLQSGSSNYPIELLKEAGVDMREETPVIEALKYFGDLVQDLKQLI